LSHIHLKPVRTETLVAAIREVHAGGSPILRKAPCPIPCRSRRQVPRLATKPLLGFKTSNAEQVQQAVFILKDQAG
jgi:hypothetical protein